MRAARKVVPQGRTRLALAAIRFPIRRDNLGLGAARQIATVSAGQTQRLLSFSIFFSIFFLSGASGEGPKVFLIAFGRIDVIAFFLVGLSQQSPRLA